MGYACPVCETPQADAGHLANHLAITAIARGGDHEAWLDDHAPDWGDLDEDALAERVVELADDADYPQVFEDTTGDDHSHDHGHGDHAHGSGEPGHGRQSPDDVPVDVDESALDPADPDAGASDIVEAARELTRQRRDDSETE